MSSCLSYIFYGRFSVVVKQLLGRRRIVEIELIPWVATSDIFLSALSLFLFSSTFFQSYASDLNKSHPGFISFAFRGFSYFSVLRRWIFNLFWFSFFIFFKIGRPWWHWKISKTIFTKMFRTASSTHHRSLILGATDNLTLVSVRFLRPKPLQIPKHLAEIGGLSFRGPRNASHCSAFPMNISMLSLLFIYINR